MMYKLLNVTRGTFVSLYECLKVSNGLWYITCIRFFFLQENKTCKYDLHKVNYNHCCCFNSL